MMRMVHSMIYNFASQAIYQSFSCGRRDGVALRSLGFLAMPSPTLAVCLYKAIEGRLPLIHMCTLGPDRMRAHLGLHSECGSTLTQSQCRAPKLLELGEVKPHPRVRRSIPAALAAGGKGSSTRTSIRAAKGNFLPFSSAQPTQSVKRASIE